MAISKKIREQVYNKYGGLCAYTGKPLDDKWQIDHITPKRSYLWRQLYCDKKCDDIDNLVPCLRIVNHYKRSLNLEGYRDYIKTLHIRLKKLPKKTRVEHTANRVKYVKEVAELFGITEDKPFEGKFYFEKICQKDLVIQKHDLSLMP